MLPSKRLFRLSVERGFDLLLDVRGADHHGYVARVRAGLEAMGEPGDSLEVTLIHFVSLFRGGEKVPMGKREAQFVTLRQLREEVGNDACRLFYLMRSNDQPLDFDLELAKSRTSENPVNYVQYGHARIASIFRKAEQEGASMTGGALLLRNHPSELALIRQVLRLREIVALATETLSPHPLTYYAQELATAFHAFYRDCRVVGDDPALTAARLKLVRAAQLTLIGWGLIGIFGFTSFSYGIAMGLVQLINAFLSVLIAGFIIDALAPSFGSQKNMGRAVQHVAYSMTPVWIAGILNILPTIGWLAGLIGLYGLFLMYLGLSPVMKSPEDKKIAYLIVSIIKIIYGGRATE